MTTKAAPAGHNLPRNPGTALTPAWFEAAQVNTSAAERRAATLVTRRSVKKEYQAAWLGEGAAMHRPDDTCWRRYGWPRAPSLRQGHAALAR
jgi:hypothetical protein